MAKDKKSAAPKQKLLEVVRKHQDALQAAGLSGAVISRYENALRGVQSHGKEPNPAAETLIKDVQRGASEVQGAIRKEFPGNASFQSVFKAGEPMPTNPRDVLALGRLIAKEVPDYQQNLIKYAINAASMKHLTSLCDQLEHELGGLDPAEEARALEQQILQAARHAFEGKPELAEFEAK